MTYQEFNRRIFHFYQARSTSSFCILSITKKEIEDIIPLSEVAKFTQLRYSWEGLLNSREGLPQYFGLLAIQCLAASFMHKDKINAEDAYKIRLCQLLDLAGNQELHALFKGDSADRPVQEEIWYSAKHFFKKHFRQDLDIPARTMYAGRYVQYPKSQSLLNLEDLKHFTSFFATEFYPGETLPFPFFKQRLEAALLNLQLTNRTWEIIQESQKREKCLQQVFEYFNTWDGTIYIPVKGKAVEKGKSTRITQHHSVLLVLEGGHPTFYSVDRQGGALVQEIAAEQLFCLGTIIRHYKGLFILTETDYPNEYEAGRFILKEKLCYILLDRTKRSAESQFLEKHNQGRFEVGPNKILYAYRHENTHRFLIHLVQQANPIKLACGIRTGRSREFLEGFGPSISGINDFRVIYDNMSCEYNPHEAACGIYKVRVDHFRDIEFRIVKPKPLSLNIPSKAAGWNMAQYMISEVFDIEGLSMTSVTKPVDVRIGRQWIQANLQGRGASRQNQLVLLKAINNSKNHDDCKSLWKSRRTQGR